MSWVTVIWSMIASACLTLAAIYALAWYKNRAAWATLLFSITAVSTAVFACCELWMIRAQTPAEFQTAVRSAQVPLFFWLVSIVWFVWYYLGAGRLWLAWTITSIRVFYLLLTFLNEQTVTALRQIQFLGESVTIRSGRPNPVILVGQLSVVLILVFVADAGFTAWRRGDGRKALMVGGSIGFFLLTSFGWSVLVAWANIQGPIVFSWLYLGLVAVMGYELSRDLLRASQLVEKLQASEARSHAILRAMPDLMFLQTTDGVYLDYYSPDPGLLLRRPEQFLGKNMRDVLTPALLDRIGPAFAQATDAPGLVVVEYDMDLANGNRQFEARMTRTSNDQILTLVRDVTEHKQAEAALRESAQRYALATTAGAVGVWDRNLVTNDLYVDTTIKALLGFEDAEIPNRVEDWSARVHPEDTNAVMTAALDAIAVKTDVFEIEHRMVHKDGSHRWFMSHGSVMRRADGTPYRMVGTSVDITERRHAVDLLRLALETSTTGMIMVDRTATIVLVNVHVEALFWYRREELLKKSVQMLILERLHLEPEGQRGLGPEGGVLSARGSRELTGVRKDGAAIPVEIGFSPFHTSEGEFVLLAVTDVSARKRAEREREDLTRHLRDLAGRMIAAQEVERSRLARDLHDDVSQQLAALSIALNGVKRRAAANPNSADLQREISALQERTNGLAESVRNLSHDLHPDVLRHAGLTAALTDYSNGLSPAVAVTCTAEGDFESLDPEAALCLFRIAQEALHNVVKHAHASHAEVRLVRTADSAEITIVDDGSGFDVDTRKSGTGLGLISITERARLAGGTVSIVTALNEGTRVRVQVPIVAKRPNDSAGRSGRFATSG